ncbi:MAG TPA: adenylyl-sulfate reductase subunit alpha [Thermoplasmata archaeon]|nr:adenylyl-sulfate reductase subunit alpha [Thermoplasmata archaeon]HTW77390.1 adenylyl-sulfate reductase subunit alpha [Thermoplasmata archaeon]
MEDGRTSAPRVVDCDLLIVGGGFAGCGAAFEARYWGRGLSIVVVEKAAIERSGAVAQGLSAINCYMGLRWHENRPEDFVRYVRNDLMGLSREDLVFDIARHVDSSVHLFEEWGLPIFTDPTTGRFVREGRWQVMIHGESYKPIVAEAARAAATAVDEGVVVTHLLKDREHPNRVAGAVGFSVRDGSYRVYRARAVIVAAGGASHLYRPRSSGEGWGRTWYPPWATGSAYGLLIPAGAEMTQMENRLVVTRFKDGYGPVGAWFLYLKAIATNGAGDSFEASQLAGLRDRVGAYADAKPLPTCLRNDLLLREVRAGRGPILMHTERVLDSPEKERVGWGAFLNMTVGQVVAWASQGTDPRTGPVELVLSEPYVLGSHAVCAGAWASGPGDVGPGEYAWGYNRMTSVEGLFGAGDTIGGSAHKFSSGSFTEGRLAAKGAVRYLLDHPGRPTVAPDEVEAWRRTIFAPLDRASEGRARVTDGSVVPDLLAPDQGLLRLEKIMDEYAGGVGADYTTNADLLDRGLAHLTLLREDLSATGATDLRELGRVWELDHRVWTAEAVVRHTRYREETRWPGYYYRSDFPRVDDARWRCFVNSVYDAHEGNWRLFTRPYVPLTEP